MTKVQPNHSQTSFDSLSLAVSISRKFLRSIQIEDDFGREDALAGYVCQGTARALLESMSGQIIGTAQRAFTWTGPYGGGKSSLALMLCSLVGPNKKLRSKAKEILNLPAESSVYEAFNARAQGWTVLPLVGRRVNVRGQLLSAVEAQTSRLYPNKGSIDVIQELVALADNNPQGVLVVIDELGKFLEHSALEGGEDIYFFQQLAEAASRARGKLIIVGILHQPFEAYATSLGRQMQDDWAKIQGRYIDIPLNTATDEVIELIGKSIEVNANIDKKAIEKVCSIVASNIQKRRPASPKNLAQSLLACWPLHPTIAALLGPISRRKFGQNERSVFGFLASREPMAFSDHLQVAPISWDAMYGPSHYWDYLRTNAEPAILASPDGHRWAIAVDAVERAEARGSVVHIVITKSIALIEMFRAGSSLAADHATIACCVAATNEEVAQALTDLQDWKVIIERKHLDAFGIFAGSDFDIDQAIQDVRREAAAINTKSLEQLSDLNPVIAKRAYYKSGAMRWFEKGLMPFSSLEAYLQTYEPSSGSVGSFILCLPDTPRNEKHMSTALQRASGTQTETPLLLGLSKNAGRITELAQDLSAAEYVMATRAELEGDPVARKELLSRLTTLKANLQEELAAAFQGATWFMGGEAIDKAERTSLPAIAADIAEAIFFEALHIKSELINRDELSRNVVKARRLLMYKMLSHEGHPDLSFEGYPAEAGLYYTVLKSSGLHTRRGPLGWAFGKPAKGMDTSGPYLNLWRVTEQFLNFAGSDIGLDEVYRLWADKPIGMKKGVMPIIAFAYILANKSRLAIYLDGIFTPELTEVIVDELLNAPKLIRLKFVDVAKHKNNLAERIGKEVLSSSIENSQSTTYTPLDTARGLVSMVFSLPNWTKRTSSVSEAAQQVRNMLLKASDPHKVLFTDLPTILKTDSEEALTTLLASAVSELRSAYPAEIERIKHMILTSLQHRADSLADLVTRARSVKGVAGKFNIESFATRLEEFDGSVASVESLISNAISKPAHTWVDRDLDHAVIELGSLATEFRKAEAVVSLQGRKSNRKTMSIIMASGDETDISQTFEISINDEEKIHALVAKLSPNFEGIEPRLILATLANIGRATMQKEGDFT